MEEEEEAAVDWDEIVDDELDNKKRGDVRGYTTVKHSRMEEVKDSDQPQEGGGEDWVVGKDTAGRGRAGGGEGGGQAGEPGAKRKYTVLSSQFKHTRLV